MIYDPSIMAVVVFSIFVAITLGISFYLGGKAKSAEGYFAAEGQIHWFVNGIAFAGDYLSAASFLGICGMIAFSGYDGFLYSIGYLAGWIVALFVVAEPMKRLGKFTFADALDSRFNSKGIKLAAGLSTLAVSIFYLIPQMVGAGALITPLLGWPHAYGVVMVGVVVIIVVVTAGMVSTTYVQFLKGSLLVIFTAILTVILLFQGFQVKTEADNPAFLRIESIAAADVENILKKRKGWEDLEFLPLEAGWAESENKYLRARKPGGPVLTFSLGEGDDGAVTVFRAQTLGHDKEGRDLVNGEVKGTKPGEPELYPVGHLSKLPGGEKESGSLGPLSFFSTLQNSEVVLWRTESIQEADGSTTKVYRQKPTPGAHVLRPGEHPRFKGIRSDNFVNKLNFLSLMLALFCGTASLPHILIRYYTVKDGVSARKSTIVGIAAIGFFYVLTLYLGLGAMTSGALDVTNSNMAAPLLAKSISESLFAIISAIAFTTVLGTVSGLILASSGAVTHDLMTHVLGIKMTDIGKVRVGKIAAVVVGGIAIVLGILFKELNVSYLVGWAFSVAASANLPALVMLLFWKGVTKEGVIASVVTGMTTSLAWILLSADTFEKVYGISADLALTPFTQPGIVTIPLAFITLIVVSLLTAKRDAS